MDDPETHEEQEPEASLLGSVPPLCAYCGGDDHVGAECPDRDRSLDAAGDEAEGSR